VIRQGHRFLFRQLRPQEKSFGFDSSWNTSAPLAARYACPGQTRNRPPRVGSGQSS